MKKVNCVGIVLTEWSLIQNFWFIFPRFPHRIKWAQYMIIRYFMLFYYMVLFLREKVDSSALKILGFAIAGFITSLTWNRFLTWFIPVFQCCWFTSEDIADERILLFDWLLIVKNKPKNKQTKKLISMTK